MKKRGRTMLMIILAALVVLALASCAVLRQPRFGKAPEGERLQRIEASPHYRNGEFANLIPTSRLAEGQSFFKIVASGLFAPKERLRPEEPLPTLKPALIGQEAIDRDEDMVLWLGHSSFFIQLGGKRLLVDPIFSDHGAPFSFLNKTFPGTDIYTADDMPEIDVLMISHDHWDHLDYATVAALKEKVRNVVCPLGVGAYFEYWGYSSDTIHEVDWNASVPFENGPTITVVPARHYSSRLFSSNKTLWAGFVIETSEHRVYLSGDTGYGPHFADIARRFGPFDLVALDGGQYDDRWPLIHMTPEEAVRAAEDLEAKAMLLAHVGRFCISTHPWDEPFLRVEEAGRGKDFRLLTPRIGEPLKLGDADQEFTRWWEGLL